MSCWLRGVSLASCRGPCSSAVPPLRAGRRQPGPGAPGLGPTSPAGRSSPVGTDDETPSGPVRPVDAKRGAAPQVGYPAGAPGALRQRRHPRRRAAPDRHASPCPRARAARLGSEHSRRAGTSLVTGPSANAGTGANGPPWTATPAPVRGLAPRGSDGRPIRACRADPRPVQELPGLHQGTNRSQLEIQDGTFGDTRPREVPLPPGRGSDRVTARLVPWLLGVKPEPVNPVAGRATRCRLRPSCPAPGSCPP